MNDSFTENKNISHDLNCKDCGALLHFAPGAQKLACQYCGAQNEIKKKKSSFKIEEIDFEKFIANQIVTEEKQTIATVNCKNCGATTTLKPNITSDDCVFCASPLVIVNGTTSTIIKPKYILPFKVEKTIANNAFDKWLKSLWFAPNDLVKRSSISEKINGVYMPYWTYDAKSYCTYEGERGDNYQSRDSKGNSTTKTRWTDVSGSVSNVFDDVCVLASHSLPQENTRRLEPWDNKNLEAFNEAYLSGFQTECYQIDVKEGLPMAKQIMESEIRDTICDDIGGDKQRINEMNPVYRNITFKHTLFPIWISAYKYNDIAYRFTVNGRTGKVDGQRPISKIKVAVFLISVIGIGGILAMLIGGNSSFAIGIFELIIISSFVTWWKNDFRFSSEMLVAFEEIKAAKEKNYK